MIYPPLPEPVIVEGRRLYTAAQMREYANACATTYESGDWIPPAMREMQPDAGRKSVDTLLGIFGVKR